MLDISDIFESSFNKLLTEKKSVNNITGNAKIVDTSTKPQKAKNVKRSTKVKTDTPKIKTPKVKSVNNGSSKPIVVGDLKSNKVKVTKPKVQSTTIKPKKKTVTTTPPKAKPQKKSDNIKRMTIRDGQTGEVKKTITPKPKKQPIVKQIQKDKTSGLTTKQLQNLKKKEQSKLDAKIDKLVNGKNPKKKKIVVKKNVVPPPPTPKFKGNPELEKATSDRYVLRINGKTFKLSPSKYQEFKKREQMRRASSEKKSDEGLEGKFHKYKNLNGDSPIISYFLSPMKDYKIKKDCKLIVRFSDGNQYTYTKKMIGNTTFNELAELAMVGKDLCKTIQEDCYDDYYTKEPYDVNKPLVANT